MSLGKRVAQARASRGWDQRRLADEVRKINPKLKSGVSTISSIETGKAKRTSMVYELSEALGVNERWLMTGEGPRMRGAPTMPSNVASILDHVFDIVSGSYERLGLSRDEAEALASICREVAEEQPIDGDSASPAARRIQGQMIAREYARPAHHKHSAA